MGTDERIEKIPRWFFAPLIIAPILLFLPALLPGRSLFWGIISIQFVPWHWEALRLIRAGEFPLWNIWNGMGAPLAANYQSALYYPPTWLTLLFGWIGGIQWMGWSHGLLVVLHLIWAGWGMQKLIKSLGFSLFPQLICGLAYGLCGYIVARGSFLTMVQAASWIPWILLAASHFASPVRQIHENSRSIQPIILLSLAFSGQWLSGHAQLAWYTLLFSMVWLITGALVNGSWKRVMQIILPVFLSGFLGFLICGIQFLPTMEYFVQSQRSGIIDYQTALSYSFWPWRVITLIFPNIFGNPGAGNYWGYASFWEDAVYIGLLPLFFSMIAVINRKKDQYTTRTDKYKPLVWFCVISILTVTLLALGWNTPVFPWLFTNIPTFGAFNGPTRWMILVEICLILLAGVGAETWISRPVIRRKWVNLGLTAVIAMLLSAIAAWVFLPTIKTSIKTGVISTGVFLAGYFLLAKFKHSTLKDHWRFRWRYSTVLWLVVDLLVAGILLNPSVPITYYPEKPSGEDVAGRSYIPNNLERDLRFERFFNFKDIRLLDDWKNLSSTNLPNINILTSTAMLNNFDPMVPSRFSGFLEEIEAAPSFIQDRYLALSNVSRKADVRGNDLHKISWKKLDVLPDAWIVHCADISYDESSAINWLKNAAIDDRLTEQITIEGTLLDGYSCEQNINGKPEIIDASTQANRRVFQIKQNSLNGWLFLSRTWYPGWIAAVDGKPVEIYRADYVFSAIPVPSGDHKIELTYRPISFTIGMILTLTGLITIIGASLIGKKASGGKL